MGRSAVVWFVFYVSVAPLGNFTIADSIVMFACLRVPKNEIASRVAPGLNFEFVLVLIPPQVSPSKVPLQSDYIEMEFYSLQFFT